jgi:CRISPR-associated protein (TIGR03986 family)
VSFGLATMIQEFRSQTPANKVVLNSPKPTFYPSYLQQSHQQGILSTRQHTTYMKEGAKLNGWKRYPVSSLRKVDKISDPQDQQKNNIKLNTILHPLGKKTRFNAKTRYHNLRAIELGALIWAIELESNLRNNIGMAKPFGYGQIKLTIAETNFNDVQGKSYSKEQLVALFKDYMTLQLGEIWSSTKEVKNLVAMLNPEAGNKAYIQLRLNYLPLSDHAKAKGASKNTKLALMDFTTDTAEV